MKTAFAACAILVFLTACKPAAEPVSTEPAKAAATATPVAYFAFGNHVPRSEIVSVEGIDTASARLNGRTSAQDNFDYCLFMTGGDQPSAQAAAQCASEKVDQPLQSMTADCFARTVSDGSDAVWVRDQPGAGGKVLPVWQDKASGDIRDYSGAGGGDVLTAAFRILCPTASANIQPASE